MDKIKNIFKHLHSPRSGDCIDGVGVRSDHDQRKCAYSLLNCTKSIQFVPRKLSVKQ